MRTGGLDLAVGIVVILICLTRMVIPAGKGGFRVGLRELAGQG